MKKNLSSLSHNPKININLSETENIKETKESLSILAKNLAQNLEELKKSPIQETLKWLDKQLDISTSQASNSIKNIEFSNLIINKLSLYSTPLSKDFSNIIYLLQLKELGETNINEIKIYIIKIMESKILPKQIKLKLIKWLKENDYLTGNPLEQVKLQNNLSIKYPTYNWFNFIQTTDGSYTNAFSQQQIA